MRMGLKKIDFKIGDNILQKIIRDYTRRERGCVSWTAYLASIMRYEAKEYAMKEAVKPTLIRKRYREDPWQA